VLPKKKKNETRVRKYISNLKKTQKHGGRGKEKCQSLPCFCINFIFARHWWLMPVILATWEAKIRRIKV
jgi:hypothetical protein